MALPLLLTALVQLACTAQALADLLEVAGVCGAGLSPSVAAWAPADPLAEAAGRTVPPLHPLPRYVFTAFD